MLERKPKIEDLARLFRALADPNRLAILQHLRECCGPGCCTTEAEEGRNVGEIAERFDIALSTVSHHIKELRAAGLVSCTKEGKRVRCTINERALERLAEFLGEGKK